ncbi:FMN-dependent NADH-azoreductase [Oscillatoria sp. FACHB-1407]|uniref:FMN-dependent NADH-azoreductase n=1 Tax=Oscillatoria sp. FACHB-1407 TaxID=2692847 RepID=UPI0016840A0E|nr:FMN-dependent NADH-azoreductase [Oscillatoria sp. FACHB-1407]MBD2463021.1 FMN-dependent NADH-azoreductase [Oscillatoria sp. FACHB-1407]
MTHILHLDSSPRGSRSVSRSLTKEFVAGWLQSHPSDRITYRDIGKYPVPPVDEAWIAASFSKSEPLASELTNALRVSDELIDELLIADRYVFGIPMYNFSVPANFKAYIDQIVRVERTFTPNWQGLVTNKKMLIITTRGGSYFNAPSSKQLDFQEPYLRAIFEFVGITDITFIHAENLTMGDEARERSLTTARTAIQSLISAW